MKKNDDSPKFLPFHFPAIFDRTIKATANGEGVICAILCLTALEAFVHDFIGWYDFVRKNFMDYGDGRYPRDNYLTENEVVILDKILSLDGKKGGEIGAGSEGTGQSSGDRGRDSIIEKFECLSAWDSSVQPYQDFRMLIQIRNSLVHLKAEELAMRKDANFVDGYPKILNDFFQRKIIVRPTHFISWIELIETQKFCYWCQNAAYKMVEETIARLPETPTKKHFIKQVFFSFNVPT